MIQIKSYCKDHSFENYWNDYLFELLCTIQSFLMTFLGDPYFWQLGLTKNTRIEVTLSSRWNFNQLTLSPHDWRMSKFESLSQRLYKRLFNPPNDSFYLYTYPNVTKPASRNRCSENWLKKEIRKKRYPPGLLTITYSLASF